MPTSAYYIDMIAYWRRICYERKEEKYCGRSVKRFKLYNKELFVNGVHSSPICKPFIAVSDEISRRRVGRALDRGYNIAG